MEEKKLAVIALGGNAINLSWKKVTSSIPHSSKKKVLSNALILRECLPLLVSQMRQIIYCNKKD